MLYVIIGAKNLKGVDGRENGIVCFSHCGHCCDRILWNWEAGFGVFLKNGTSLLI